MSGLMSRVTSCMNIDGNVLLTVEHGDDIGQMGRWSM
jgi:hypothetical protein